MMLGWAAISPLLVLVVFFLPRRGTISVWVFFRGRA